MASPKQLDVNVISRNGISGKNRLVGIDIDSICVVWKDHNNVTTIKMDPADDVHASNTPVRFKVLETLGDIITKANNADFNNGLIQVTVTKANGFTLVTPSTQIINRVKIQVMTPIYNDAGAVTGTKIKLGYWRQTILEIEENLVTNTSSSQD